jgi:hypothetical protein
VAISSGAGPHFAWVSVNGAMFPLTSGGAEQNATRKSSSFYGELPLNYPGALATFGTLGANSSAVIVSTRGITEPLVTGEIDVADCSFVKGIIRFAGRDQSAQLHALKTNQTWTNQLGSQIVQQLASMAGLGVQADPSTLLAGKMVNIDYAKIADGVSAATVIHKLAELDGARWWVKNGTLYYQLLSNPAGIYTLNYVPPTPESPMAADFLDLQVKRNIQASKNISVTVKSWHPRQKQVFTGQANAGGSGGGQQTYEYHLPNLLQDHAQQYATSKANDIASNALKLTAKCVGDPTIDVAMGLVLSGTGIFDQLYQMDSIHHLFGMKGHTMTISARLPSSGGAGTGGAIGGSAGIGSVGGAALGGG